MTKKRLRIGIIIALLVCLWTFLMLGNTRLTCRAEELTEETQTEEETTEKRSVAEEFIEKLKEKYGDDYDYYYTAIIDKWGSVENYLLSVIDEKAPDDKTAEGWCAFVSWLGEYSPVWASILAIGCVVLIILLGKKALNKIAEYVTGNGQKFKTLFAEINKIDSAQAAQNAALIKLLGRNEQFREEREALEKSVEEIKDDGEV